MAPITTIRLIVQLSFFILFFGGLFGLQVTPSVVLPVLVCRDLPFRTVTCAFGLLQRNLSLDTELNSSPIIAILPILSLISMIVVGVIFGRMLCGWACPVGLVEDLLTRFRSIFKIKYREFPERVHAYLVDFKYAFLFILIVISLSVGVATILDAAVGAQYKSILPYDMPYEPACLFCPAPMLFVFIPDLFILILRGITANPLVSWISLSIMTVFFIGSFFVRRFWCRYICPLSALMVLFNKISFFAISKDVERCSKCGVCLRCCPMRSEKVMSEDNDVRVVSSECIQCFRCVEKCPEKVLKISAGKKVIYPFGGNQ